MDRRQYLTAERLFELCNEHLEDPRRPSGNIRHKLIDIFVIGLLGIMGGLEDWESIEEYGYTKQNWLKTFLELPNGMPSDDTYSSQSNALSFLFGLVQQFQSLLQRRICTVAFQDISMSIFDLKIIVLSGRL